MSIDFSQIDQLSWNSLVLAAMKVAVVLLLLISHFEFSLLIFCSGKEKKDFFNSVEEGRKSKGKGIFARYVTRMW